MARVAAPPLRRAADRRIAAAQELGARPRAQPHRHHLGLAAEGVDRPRRRAAGRQRRLRGLETGVMRRAPWALGLGALGLGAVIASTVAVAVLAQPAGGNQPSSDSGAS